MWLLYWTVWVWSPKPGILVFQPHLLLPTVITGFLVYEDQREQFILPDDIWGFTQGVCGLELESNQDLRQLEGLAPLSLTFNSPNQKISLGSDAGVSTVCISSSELIFGIVSL